MGWMYTGCHTCHTGRMGGKGACGMGVSDGSGVTLTAPLEARGASGCGSHSIEQAEIKRRGGARPGAGRPRRAVASVAIGLGRDGLRWYCVEAESGRELAVAGAIERQGWPAFVPRMLDRDGRLVLCWSRYLFAEFDWRGTGWRAIAHTRGVLRLLGPSPEAPEPVAAGEMAWLLAQFGPDGVQRLPPVAPRAWPVGAAVRVAVGPMAGVQGVVRRCDGRRSVIDVGGRAVAAPAAVLAGVA